MKLLPLGVMPALMLILATGCRTTYPINVENFPDAGSQDAAADGLALDPREAGVVAPADAELKADTGIKAETGGSPLDTSIDKNSPDTSSRDAAADAADAVPDSVVHNGPGTIMIAAGWVSGCAVLDDRVKCWGAMGWPASAPKAVAVPGIGKLVSISSSPSNYKLDLYCGALADQGLACWTVDFAGKASAAPSISLPLGIKNIALSSERACALLRDGTIRCWGSNKAGQLGDGTLNDSPNAAVKVLGISNAVTVVSNSFAGTPGSCAILADGTVKCWGSSFPTYPTPPHPVPVPLLVPDIAEAKSIARGDVGACVVLRDGTVKCWGYYMGGGSRRTPANYPECEQRNPGGRGSLFRVLPSCVGSRSVPVKQTGVWSPR